MAEKVAKFRLVDYKIIKSNINISEFNDIKNKLSIKFTSEGGEVSENLFQIEINTTITNEDKTLLINVTMIGHFKFDADLNNKENFFNVNAPAILFPYIRAYISTLTALSGIPPIILPTLNIAARLNKTKGK